MPNPNPSPNPSSHDDDQPYVPQSEPRVAHFIEPEPAPRYPSDQQEAEAEARRLVRELLDGAKDDKERERRLREEPEHPLVMACYAWMAAIAKGNLLKAEVQAERVARLMLTYYSQRPAYQMPFSHLKLAEALSQENLPWLEKLIAAVRG